MKLLDILNEGKQVGNLYHFTNLPSLYSILELNLMIGFNLRDYYNIRELPKYLSKYKYGISTTRDKNFSSNSIGGMGVLIKLDGNLISNNYSVVPHSDFRDKSNENESEELILLSNLTLDNINKYIIDITVFKHTSIKEATTDNFLDSEDIIKLSTKKTKDMIKFYDTINKLEDEDILDETILINLYIKEIQSKYNIRLK